MGRIYQTQKFNEFCWIHGERTNLRVYPNGVYEIVGKKRTEYDDVFYPTVDNKIKDMYKICFGL